MPYETRGVISALTGAPFLEQDLGTRHGDPSTMVGAWTSTTGSRVSSHIGASILSFGRFGQVFETSQTAGPILVKEHTKPAHAGLVSPFRGGWFHPGDRYVRGSSPV